MITVILAADAATTPERPASARWIDRLVVDDLPRAEAEALLKVWRPVVNPDGGEITLRGRSLGGDTECVRVGPLRDAEGRIWLPVYGGEVSGLTSVVYRCQPEGTPAPADTIDAFLPAYALLNPTPYYATDDSFFAERLREIIVEYRIEVIVETGINAGLSTAAFAGLVNRVVGIDIDPMCLVTARENCRLAGRDNIELRLGSSPEVLSLLLPGLPDATLYFLDAHWGEYWPLLDEIKVLAKHRPGRGVIVIHDCKVPGKNFGFDKYGGRELDYEYVREALTMWSPQHRIEYNSEVSGSGVGILYVFPE